MCSVNQLSGSVPTPDSHSSRRSALPERGTPAALVELNPNPLLWTIPTVTRVTIKRHTRKKLVYETGETRFQAGHYCCSGDAEWQTVLEQSNLCDRLRQRLNAYLTELGTYEQERTALKWQDKPLPLFG